MMVVFSIYSIALSGNVIDPVPEYSFAPVGSVTVSTRSDPELLKTLTHVALPTVVLFPTPEATEDSDAKN